MRVLHISDLHYRQTDQEDRAVILKALAEDLKAFVGERAFDAVVFTGDLVFSGTSPGVFREAFDVCLRPILSQLSLSPDCLALVPGNHDIDISAVDVYITNELRHELNSVDAVNAFLDDPAKEAYRSQTLANFFTFCSDYGCKASVTSDRLGRVFCIDTKSGLLTVAAGNSAWRATGRPNDADRNALLIGERQLQHLTQGVSSEGLRLFAAHHPPEWLASFDAECVASEIATTYDLALFGHTHQPKPMYVEDQHGRRATSVAGALYEDPRVRNAYTILDFDESDRMVALIHRAYVPGRHAFDVDTEMAPGGRLEIPLGGAKGRPSALAVGMELVRSNAVASLSEALTAHMKLLQRPLRREAGEFDLLIEPPCYTIRERSAEAVGDKRDTYKVQLKEWLASDARVLVLYGDRESGKTCAVHWLLHAQAKEGPGPVYIDFDKLGGGPGALIGEVRHALMSVGLRTKEDLSDAPPLIVGVDNFRPHGGKRSANLLNAMVGAPESVRFVLAISDDPVVPATEVWMPATVKAKVAYLGNYRTRQIRALAKRLYPYGDDNWDEMVRSVVNMLVNQGLPRTPRTVVLVLLLFQYEPVVVATDVTALVDKYVDIVLGKWNVLPSRSEKVLDFADRKRFLSSLAVELVRRNASTISEPDLLSFTDGYFKAYGLGVQAVPVIEDLVDRRVLGGSPNTMGFISRDMASFFVASGVQLGLADPELLLRRVRENFDAIVHLCGLTRNQVGVLDHAAALLASLTTKLGQGPKVLFDSVEAQSWRGLPEVSSTLRGLGRIGELAAELQTSEAEDRLGDESLEKRGVSEEADPVAEAEVDEPAAQAGMDALFEAALLLSLALQRSEYVGDQQRKVELAAQALDGWVKVFMGWCALTASQDEQESQRRRERLESAGVTPEKAQMMDELMAFMMANGSATTFLSSRKLAVTWERVYREKRIGAEVSIQLMFSCLAMFNEMPGWYECMSEVVHRYGKVPHVLRFIHSWAAWKYYLESTDVDTLPLLERVIGEVAIESYGNNAKGKAARNAMLQEIRKRRALNLTPSADGAEDVG